MVTVSPSGPPGLFKGVTTAMSGVLARFPLLLPVRNSFASYGASAVTRTRDRGHVAEVKKPISSGFGVSIRVSKETFLPLNVQPVFSSHHKDELLYARTYQRCVMRMIVRTMDVRVNMGDTIDPFQLANGVEAVIGDEYQERSNHPFSRKKKQIDGRKGSCARSARCFFRKIEASLHVASGP